jgi:hypothetical protein
MLSLEMMQTKTVTFVVLAVQILSVCGKIAFEKLTDYDFAGTTYYSVKNLSLYECQGWCNQEPECQAAAFSFVVNPLLPEQETLCQLQNDTQAMNPSALPQRSNSMYYMVKMNIRSENICMRPWAFERVPNKIIRGLDNALIYTSTKEACLAACLNEVRKQKEKSSLSILFIFMTVIIFFFLSSSCLIIILFNSLFFVSLHF